MRLLTSLVACLLPIGAQAEPPLPATPLPSTAGLTTILKPLAEARGDVCERMDAVRRHHRDELALFAGVGPMRFEVDSESWTRPAMIVSAHVDTGPATRRDDRRSPRDRRKPAVVAVSASAHGELFSKRLRLFDACVQGARGVEVGTRVYRLVVGSDHHASDVSGASEGPDECMKRALRRVPLHGVEGAAVTVAVHVALR